MKAATKVKMVGGVAVEDLPNYLRNIRSMVRGFLLTATATPTEMEGELKISVERKDTFRADCVREVLAEVASGEWQ